MGIGSGRNLRMALCEDRLTERHRQAFVLHEVDLAAARITVSPATEAQDGGLGLGRRGEVPAGRTADPRRSAVAAAGIRYTSHGGGPADGAPKSAVSLVPDSSATRPALWRPLCGHPRHGLGIWRRFALTTRRTRIARLSR
jgi:hypothetical protein